MHSNAKAGEEDESHAIAGIDGGVGSLGRRWIGGGNGNGNPIIQLCVSGEEDGCVT